jgi:hypothetical protein
VAVVRPPGHHACVRESSGFCCFNNLGIAVRAAQRRSRCKKVMVVDWDVHHGNGTQDGPGRPGASRGPSVSHSISALHGSFAWEFCRGRGRLTAGSGARAVFWEDNSVLTVSVHRGDPGFFPMTGTPEEIGEGKVRRGPARPDPPPRQAHCARPDRRGLRSAPSPAPGAVSCKAP